MVEAAHSSPPISNPLQDMPHPDRPISPQEADRRLCIAVGAGNMQFPQAYFAQGVHLAKAMVDLAQQGVSWHELLRKEPTKEAIEMMGKQRATGHAVHHIETNPVEIDYSTIWASDSDHAEVFLRKLALIAYMQKNSFFSRPFASRPSEELLEEVFSHPDRYAVESIIQVVKTAHSVITKDPEIDRYANEYKREISKFMQDYNYKKQSESDSNFSPEKYKEAKRILRGKLQIGLNDVAILLRNGIIGLEDMKDVNPDTTYLSRRVERIPADALFGSIYVADIDPLH